MEITLEGIVALITLFVGGGSIGGFLFWRQTKRKAKAFYHGKGGGERAVIDNVTVPKARIGEPFFLVTPKPYFTRLLD